MKRNPDVLERLASLSGAPSRGFEDLLQRRAKRELARKIGAIAVVTVLVVALLGIGLGTLDDRTESPAIPPPFTTSIVPGAANGSMVNVDTGAITPLPASIETSGSHYAVSPPELSAPDHTTIAYNMCCTAPGAVRLANIDGTQIREVTPNGWDAYGVQWSPDGSMLVYQQRHATTRELGNLFVLNVSTGHLTTLTNLDQTQDWGYWAMLPSFASDSRSVLFQLPRGGNPNNPIEDLWSVPVTGGKPTLVRRNAGDGVYSPDGKWLAYVSPATAKSSALWIMSVHGGTPRALLRGGDTGWLRWSPDSTRISYSNGDGIYVLTVATGSTKKVAEGGGNTEWVDDHTLVVGNPTNG